VETAHKQLEALEQTLEEVAEEQLTETQMQLAALVELGGQEFLLLEGLQNLLIFTKGSWHEGGSYY
jgi:hypothetical protein